MSALLRALIILVLAGAASPAAAHSLKDLEASLDEREQYFEPTAEREAPGFELQDASGRTIRLDDFRGKAVVLHFIYASCPDVCPLHAEKLAELQDMTAQAGMAGRVQFVTITTDPERDGPEVMEGYGPAHGLDPKNWVFLTSGPERPAATRELAEPHGHRFAPTPDGMQMHGVVTHVIDRDGRLKANFHGLKFEPSNLVIYVNALLNDSPHPHGPKEMSFWDRLRALF